MNEYIPIIIDKDRGFIAGDTDFIGGNHGYVPTWPAAEDDWMGLPRPMKPWPGP